jgi:hypothetical protein
MALLLVDYITPKMWPRDVRVLRVIERARGKCGTNYESGACEKTNQFRIAKQEETPLV